MASARRRRGTDNDAAADGGGNHPDSAPAEPACRSRPIEPAAENAAHPVTSTKHPDHEAIRPLPQVGRGNGRFAT
jgi:hypothetical protein